MNGSIQVYSLEEQFAVLVVSKNGHDLLVQDSPIVGSEEHTAEMNEGGRIQLLPVGQDISRLGMDCL